MTINLKAGHVAQIQTLLTGTVSDELEFRIREYNSDGNLVEGIHKGTFYRILRDNKPKTVVSDIVSGYADNIRVISTNGKDLVQRKVPGQFYLVDFYFFNLKLSKATETTLSIKAPSTVPTRKVRRTRYIFEIDGSDAELHLTQVEDLINTRTTYQLEIEINKNKTDVKQVIGYLKKALTGIVYPKIPFFSDDAEKFVVIDAKIEPRKYTNHPVNLVRGVDVFQNYSCTNKLNGRTMLLYYSNESSRLNLIAPNINKNDIYGFLSFPMEKRPFNMVAIGEYVDHDAPSINLFDMIVWNNQQITELSHKQRLDKIPLNFLTPQGLKVFMKDFFFPTNQPGNNIVNCLRLTKRNYGDKYTEYNDGLIFTSVGTYFQRIHKWKFPELMSIDFLLKNERIDGEKKVFNAFVSGKTAIQFLTKGHPAEVVADMKNATYDYIANSDIVECVYTGSNFVPIRIRYDKPFANSLKVANSVFADIQTPYTLSELLKNAVMSDEDKKTFIGEDIGGQLKTMREYHNIVKRDLINKYCSNKAVLDFGAGRGGDLFKYQKANIKQLFAIEPNVENYTEFIERNSKMDKKFQNKVELIKDYAEAPDLCIGSKVDVITMFFSLTFFYKTSRLLDSLIANIANNSHKGTLLVGTFMDGDKFRDWIDSSPNQQIRFGGSSISQDYKNTESRDQFGHKVNIHLDDTIVKSQEEYTSYFNLFRDRLELYGFKMVNTEMFNPPNTLSGTVYELSRTNRTFVFEYVEARKLVLSSGNYQDFTRLYIPKSTAGSVELRDLYEIVSDKHTDLIDVLNLIDNALKYQGVLEYFPESNVENSVELLKNVLFTSPRIQKYQEKYGNNLNPFYDCMFLLKRYKLLNSNEHSRVYIKSCIEQKQEPIDMYELLNRPIVIKSDLEEYYETYIKNKTALETISRDRSTYERNELNNIAERYLISGYNGVDFDYLEMVSNDNTFKRELKSKKLDEGLFDQFRKIIESSTLVVHKPDEVPSCSGDKLVYRDFNVVMTPRMKQILAHTDCEYLTKLSLMYGSLLPRGQQWGLTSSHFDKLYKLGVRNEAFASPFNSRLYGKPDTHFGSIFWNLDSRVGSIGNFFNVDMLEYKGDWQVNPPFVESILERAAEKSIRTIKSAPGSLKIFFYGPKWTDSEYYKMLEDYINKSGKGKIITYTADSYYMQDSNGREFLANFDTVYFVLSTQPLEADFKI